MVLSICSRNPAPAKDLSEGEEEHETESASAPVVVVVSSETTPAFSDSAEEIPSSKRAKTAKKAAFTRIWLEEDEILCLQALVDYKSSCEGEVLPKDLRAFYDSVKSSFSFVVTDFNQVRTKIWNLKNKYIKLKKNGDEHDRSLGGDEEVVKAKLRSVSSKTRKRLKKLFNLLEAEKNKCFLLKAQIVKEVTSAIIS
ncbi:PREDICTED: probable transcription factor At4g00610 [Camelina sativa]|uniref:Probable transcription factor At4g00610 n=1 Tax=Camelina sativa TaxID=90675 RepID=A0ABM1REI3_CAMSA|nr:PREDICTED: probable transcription factor At4g00610 [Camelina sativa]